MHAHFFAKLACAGAGIIVCTAVAMAADPAPVRDFATYQPTAPATRILASEAPKIDANLSDAAWAKAPIIDEFYQLEPKEKQAASERTEVRVLFDENNIYFAFHVYDREPDKITASVKSRDGSLSQDDLIRIYLDPYKTRRDGYLFEVNPLGARFDGLLQNNSDILAEWDTIWHAQARIVEDGWIAEVAIPFRSISYDITKGDWGFDLFRLIRRKGERIRWAQIDNQRTSRDISRSGTLAGINGTAQGLGLDIQPFLAARYKHEWRKPVREDDVTLEPSGNLYYKITPALTGTLTFNTDFSDAPLDQRQINTGRFGLFFPETRDFFLQDAAVFEFGGNNMNNDVNGRPFFSRNIGLVNGIPVDIVAGGKLSGQLGDLGIGALIVDTAGTPTTDNQILSAARFTLPVLDQSKIGLVFTNGDPSGATENTVAGGDFQFRNSTWFDGKTLQADFYYDRSFSSAFGDDDSFGAQIAFPNEPFSTRFQFKQVGENYAPALGFVNRPAIRYYDGNFVYRGRPTDSWMRFWETGTWYNFVTDLNDKLESQENGGWAGFQTQDTDAAFLNLFRDYENTPAFFLPRGVLVPAGEYTWTAVSLNLETSIGRPVSGNFEIRCCDWYGGTLFRTFAFVNWRPDSTWELGLQHQFLGIDLPTGDVEIQIWALNVGLNFTPDMNLRTQVQYDNISQAFGLSARYRWEFEPGSELFVSLGESGDLIDGHHYTSSTTQLSVRVGQLMRF